MRVLLKTFAAAVASYALAVAVTAAVHGDLLGVALSGTGFMLDGWLALYGIDRLGGWPRRQQRD